MKHIAILALQDATLSCIDSAYQVLTRVNDFLKYQGKAPYYQVELIGAEKHTQLNHGLYTIRANRTLSELKQTDVVIMPLLCGDFGQAVSTNQAFGEWTIAQYRQGAELVSLCAGSFFLAGTGLLDGRKCAVHWAAQQEFRDRYPKVKVISDTIITDEQGIYTCGGGFSYLNLLLYVIEKHLGREMSILASKMFEIDIERKSQQPFVIFQGQKRHGDELVLAAQQFIETHATDPLTITALCTHFHTGRRAFERRFKKHTGNSVAEYVQRVKVEYIKKQLESGAKNINELVYSVGYNDVNAFRKVFKKLTDLTPAAYREKYR